MLHKLDDLLLETLFRPFLGRAECLVSGATLARASLVGALTLQTAVLAWDLRVMSDPLALCLPGGVLLAEFIVAGLVQAEIDLAEAAMARGAASPARSRLVAFRLMMLPMLGVAVCVWLGSAFRLPDHCSLAAVVLWFATLFLVSADRDRAVLILPEFRVSMPRRQQGLASACVERRGVPR